MTGELCSNSFGGDVTEGWCWEIDREEELWYVDENDVCLYRLIEVFISVCLSLCAFWQTTVSLFKLSRSSSYLFSHPPLDSNEVTWWYAHTDQMVDMIFHLFQQISFALSFMSQQLTIRLNFPFFIFVPSMACPSTHTYMRTCIQVCEARERYPHLCLRVFDSISLPLQDRDP